MKKFVLVLSSICVLVLLNGCGSEESSSATPVTTTSSAKLTNNDEILNMPSLQNVDNLPTQTLEVR